MSIINNTRPIIRINAAGAMYRTCDGLTCRPDGTPDTGLYVSRYWARKAATGDDVAIKVCGGYKVMSAAGYNVWRAQR